jgi:hypothetical protein
VDINGFGAGAAFNADIDRLRYEIDACDQAYSWPVKTFIFKSWPRDLLSFPIFLSFMALIGLLVGFFVCRHSLVNVDPALVLSEDEYYKQLAFAIKSTSANDKLNVLLRSQVKGFKDAAPILAALQRGLFACSAALIILFIIAFIRRAVARTYPVAFFALGAGKPRLERLRRSREIWTVVIVLGFVINIVAGVVVAFFYDAAG